MRGKGKAHLGHHTAKIPHHALYDKAVDKALTDLWKGLGLAFAILAGLGLSIILLLSSIKVFTKHSKMFLLIKDNH